MRYGPMAWRLACWWRLRGIELSAHPLPPESERTKGGMMTIAAPKTAKQEWAAHWGLPFVAMLGMCACVALSYSNGVFVVAMCKEFGWTRAQFSSAFSLQMLL